MNDPLVKASSHARTPNLNIKELTCGNNSIDQYLRSYQMCALSHIFDFVFILYRIEMVLPLHMTWLMLISFYQH